MAFTGNAAPNDYLVRWQLSRTGTLGSGTGPVTLTPLDAGDPAVQTAAGQIGPLTSAGLASGGALFDMGVHMRAPFVFTCVPAHEFTIPAIASNAFQVFTPTVTTAYAAIANLWHFE